ncbi:EAL domain-containing protein [Eubacterium aggregans]|uniref:EAL domain-containing protein n=1 Tax=Eubacterium aggregans TaxID=81409 RepID=UPI003F3BB256
MGMVFPEDFVPLFERENVIGKLDFYVWEKCYQFQQKWMKYFKGEEYGLNLAVNLSRVDLEDRELPQRLRHLFGRYNIGENYLRFEIKETSNGLNTEPRMETLKEMQAIGISLEMDDFGCGFSELYILKEIQVKVIKIDKSFLNIGNNYARQIIIIKMIIQLAKKLGIQVIVEGIEVEVQAALMAKLGCFYMQGYYFGKPIAENDFVKYLMDHPPVFIRERDEIGN